MPFSLFRPKPTEQSIARIIEQAKKKLADISLDKKDNFLGLLELRINDFVDELKKPSNLSEKDLILEQYAKFAKTLDQCLSHPSQTHSFITYYHSGHRNFYYPVGIKDMPKPNPTVHKITVSAACIGTFLFLLSLPAFAINPLAGFILLAVAITLLLPSSFALLLPDSPDTTELKRTERAIFQEGALLLKPELTFEESNSEPAASARLQFN